MPTSFKVNHTSAVAPKILTVKESSTADSTCWPNSFVSDSSTAVAAAPFSVGWREVRGPDGFEEGVVLLVERGFPVALELDQRLLIGFDALCGGCAGAEGGDEDETERFAPLHVEPFRV